MAEDVTGVGRDGRKFNLAPVVGGDEVRRRVRVRRNEGGDRRGELRNSGDGGFITKEREASPPLCAR